MHCSIYLCDKNSTAGKAPSLNPDRFLAPLPSNWAWLSVTHLPTHSRFHRVPNVVTLCGFNQYHRRQNEETGSWFNIKMSYYQCRKTHCGDKTILRSSYLHNGIPYTGKTISLYWIRAQGASSLKCVSIPRSAHKPIVPITNTNHNWQANLSSIKFYFMWHVKACVPSSSADTRWRHEMEIFSMLLALCERNPAVTGGFPHKAPVTHILSFLWYWSSKLLNKKRNGRWFEAYVKSQ